MAGLGRSDPEMMEEEQMAPEAAAPAPAPTPHDRAMAMSLSESEDEVVENASPEEQALYNRAVGAALMPLYKSDQLQDDLAKAVEADPDPENTVGYFAAQLGIKSYMMAKEAGVKIPGDMVLPAMKEITEATIEVAEEAGVATFTPQMMEAAYYKAMENVQQFAQEEGDYTPEEAMLDLATLNDMKEDGRMDALLQVIMQEQEGEPGPGPAAPGPDMEGVI